VLGDEDGERFSRIFNVMEPGNYREQPDGRRTGKNILRLRRPLASRAHEFATSEDDLLWFVEEGRQKLLTARQKRVHPATDDKILTDWNALMIAALAKAARAFDDPGYLAAAEKATGFILTRLRGQEGRLLHRYRNGEAGLTATLDDYAFMIWALVEVYSASFSPDYLRTAVDLSHDLIARYQDDRQGGFFFVPDDTDLPLRQKPIYDGAIPSGNSVAMYALFVLGRMTANLELEETANRIRSVFAGTVSETPAACSHFLTGLEFMLGPNFEVIISGVPGAEDTKAMIGAIRSHYAPEAVVIFRPSDEEDPEITGIAGFTRDIVTIGEKATAYVCTNYACDIPTTDPDEMVRLVRSTGRSPEPIV
ncbi:MAG: thioredoxin domain-containing protein, partial [Methanoculleus sp.]